MSMSLGHANEKLPPGASKPGTPHVPSPPLSCPVGRSAGDRQTMMQLLKFLFHPVHGNGIGRYAHRRNLADAEFASPRSKRRHDRSLLRLSSGDGLLLHRPFRARRKTALWNTKKTSLRDDPVPLCCHGDLDCEKAAVVGERRGEEAGG